MLNSRAPRWEELRASPLLSANEIIERLDLETLARLLEHPLPAEEIELMRWLADEGIITADGNGYYITNFGAIAVAKQLEQFDSLSRKRIRLIRYRGTNKVDTIDELMGHKGYAAGFEGLIGYLKRILPHSEVIQQSLRREVSVYPEIALRELIANSLIHQDFSITGAGPTVEIFDDRITFTNPGTLLPGKRVDRLIGTTPESRNEQLASNFRRYRICEERGTGFQKVVQSIELYGLPPVQFSPQENAFQVTLFAPRKFAEMSQAERIEACYQHAVLQYLSSQTLTNTTLRERFKVSEKQRNQITNLIADAVTAGRIKRKDKRYRAALASHQAAVANKDANGQARFPHPNPPPKGEGANVSLRKHGFDAEQEAQDEMNALMLFKRNLGAFQRVYAFLSQIFDYGNTAIEKRAIFFKRLLPLLEFGREREGVDLSKVTLTHHKLKDQGKRNLALVNGEYPKLSPLSETGSGEVREKEKIYLAEIITKVNELFGNDTTDSDQLVYVNHALKGKLLESETLVQQAQSNSKEQFANSPDLNQELLNAIMDALTAHSSLSKQALDSERVRGGLKDILLGPAMLDEALRAQGQAPRI